MSFEFSTFSKLTADAVNFELNWNWVLELGTFGVIFEN